MTTSTLNWTRSTKSKITAIIVFALTLVITAVACSGGGGNQAANADGIPPEVVVDYIHTVAASDRTAYTRHVVNRLSTLEGIENEDGVIEAEATEFWEENDGIPLPAQMFRMGAELASEGGNFTIGLISTWYINDAHEPRGEFEETGVKEVEETGETYKGYQEVSGQRYYSAIYPDKAVAPACVSCHNTHPVHLERYPDKVFEMGDVMGGVIINLPLDNA